MKAFDIGLSALRAQQLTLSVQGNNLANASTPGYHRQVARLASRAPLRDDHFSIGSGVNVTGVERLQTAAIEISRRRPMAVIAALQPGTVRSKLSQPFAGDDALDPRLSAQRLLSVIDKLEPSGRAIFVDHQGETIPW